MKAGTIVRMADGREGTVVYNSLDGVGIRWGRLEITPEVMQVLVGGAGSLFRGAETAIEREWCPEAMLRESYPSADLPCVGTDYEVVNSLNEREL